MIRITHYLDYKEYLRDLFNEVKKEKEFFSHRYLALRLGLKSSGHILFVIQGKRRLTENVALKIADYFKFTQLESDYLIMLVHYCNARASKEKQYYFGRLSILRKKTMKKVSAEQFNFYDKWYYSAIREILDITPFDGDFKTLGKSLIPPITEKEAQEAVLNLVKLGFIITDDEGKYHKADKIISAGKHWQSQIIRNLQSTFIDLSKEALYNCPVTERDISTCTVSISEKSLELIREKIENLRTEILSLAALDEQPDKVYQCNFQVFPLYKSVLGGNE